MPRLRQHLRDRGAGELAVQDDRRRAGGCTQGAGCGELRHLWHRLDPHLGTADIEAAAKVQLNHVAYKGDGPMMQDLLGGRLGFGAVLASSVRAQVQAGTLRLLAVYSDQRHPHFPAVPTLTESGVPVVQLSFGGLLAPKTPTAVLDKLQAACERAVKSPGYVDWAAKAGQVVEYQPAEAFGRKLREDSRAKAATIQRLGL
ncbi:tripartite tricarboxylate transporter substrate-binding protein [Ottowia beijingensis]|uniref:tripartite tricarboxylate transporter substrate-binding protein n=1 Tax=Ottowia beijingensis TaxID=1207057 RepID=UPI00280504E4|nr:tripartite tricarboxylate transporter substrate-binding protein [Ottowia beijingensis]